MKKTLFLILIVASQALAGERLLGSIVSGTGADTTNASTAVPFAIPPASKLTIVCNAAAYICANSSTTCTASLAGANPGVPVSSNEKFPTSANVGDLTTTSGAAVSPPKTVVVASKKSVTFRIVGTAAVTCHVWARNGDE